MSSLNHKQLYREQDVSHLPLFHRPFWLDVVAEDNWDVALVTHEDRIIASMPYMVKKSISGSEIVMPQLTQFLGPYLSDQSGNYRERFNSESRLLEDLLSRLPTFGHFDQRWHFRYQNWLPFYWQAFHQTTRYTYILPDISDTDQLWTQFNEKARREIRKAEAALQITVEKDAASLYEIIEAGFDAKKMQVPFKRDLLFRLVNTCISEKGGLLLLARNQDREAVAGIFVAWDHETAYYIIGGKLKESGNSGAMSYLFWNAFQKLKGRVSVFDFEGSMIKGVEGYFRTFGAIQKPYFRIYKTPSLLSSLKNQVRKIVR